jgi:hypothetical protein
MGLRAAFFWRHLGYRHGQKTRPVSVFGDEKEINVGINIYCCRIRSLLLTPHKTMVFFYDDIVDIDVVIFGLPTPVRRGRLCAPHPNIMGDVAVA